MKMSKKSKVILYILLTIVAVYFLAPFVYMLLTTFKTEGEAIAYPPSFFPKDWHFENYAEAWSSQPFGTYFLNSVLVTVLTTAGTILSSSLVAYGFARFRFRGKNILFMILLATMMIPWDVTMIPQYMEFNLFGWINTLLPLIVPTWFGSAYYVFLMRQFLMGIPKDYEEAARLDGANAFQIYWKIFMPILKPCLIMVGVLNMLTVWNDYLGPLIFPAGQNQVHTGAWSCILQGRTHNGDYSDAVYYGGYDYSADSRFYFCTEIYRGRNKWFHQIAVS